MLDTFDTYSRLVILLNSMSYTCNQYQKPDFNIHSSNQAYQRTYIKLVFQLSHISNLLFLITNSKLYYYGKIPNCISNSLSFMMKSIEK